MHYGAFLFNMEFLNYTQYIDEHSVFDLNALKNTTDTFVSGKQYSYSTSLVFCTASMSSDLIYLDSQGRRNLVGRVPTQFTVD